MSDHTLSLADALTRAASTIHQSSSLEDTLDAIVHSTRSSVPGFDHVGISIVHRDGTIETRSGTGQLVWELDTLQYELREGPCYEAIRAGRNVVAEHVCHDQRWPRYTPRAAELGLRAQLGLHLYDDGRTIGGLNLYSTESGAIDSDAVHAAELFATHASIALGHTQEQQQLNEALATRKVIGQAIGIIMERFRIDEDRALQFLVRASSTSNIKLRDVAQELVTTTDEGFQRT
jgi:GAF domain-containing protein